MFRLFLRVLIPGRSFSCASSVVFSVKVGILVRISPKGRTWLVTDKDVRSIILM